MCDLFEGEKKYIFTPMNDLGYILRQDILSFLYEGTLDELTGGKRAIGSNPASPGDDEVWKSAVPTSVERVKGYGRHWYDMDTEMRSIFEYSASEAVTEGQRVADAENNGERALFVCIQDAPAGTLLTNSAYFAEKDDRNAVLVEITAKLIIYLTSVRLNPRQVPEQRQIDYDNAFQTLRDIQTGKMQLAIAERPDDEIEADDAGHQIAYGNFDNVTQASY